MNSVKFLISTNLYEYDGWKITYQYKPASTGFERANPVLLVHPVGIGQSSWFCTRLIDCWEGPSIVAVNLIGCGINLGSDPWDPDQKGLSIPLTWVKSCEALMKQICFESASKEVEIGGGAEGLVHPFSVVVQGGLTPVGVLLAWRNLSTVEKLVLTSPPTWKTLTSDVPENELKRNYDFLRSGFGSVAFWLLETRWAIRFFSDKFLFADKCDEAWLDEALKEACKEARPPVQVFNSGFAFHRSYEEELRLLKQPTLILVGSDDERNPERLEFQQAMANCSLQTPRKKRTPMGVA
ncbi:hypothetical protein ACA910_005084 [Epithemia clementina (nom. ined.)]